MFWSLTLLHWPVFRILEYVDVQIGNQLVEFHLVVLYRRVEMNSGFFVCLFVFKYTHFNFNLEKAMATHSSTLAWRVPWTEEPGGLQSMESQRVGHNWAPSLSLFTFMHWRRKWQPAPVFLPGESQGQRSLGLPSMGLHRVRCDWSDLAAAATLIFGIQQHGAFFLRGECDANKVLTFWGPGLSLLVKWSALEICGSRKILCQGGIFLYGQKGFVILIL